MMIEESLVRSVCKTIKRGNRVNRILPKGGKLMIDQPLPFLCVYRYSELPDPNFIQLIKTQASYLIAEESLSIRELLGCMIKLGTEKFNSFLIIELWPDADQDSREFRILCPKMHAPATVKALSKGLEELAELHPSLTVNICDSHQRHPDHLSPLLSIEDSKELGSLVIGVCIPTVYQESASRNLFSLFFRKFKAKFSRSIKKAVFEFMRVQTSHKLSHYLVLGKSRIDNLVRFTDKQLAAISEKMNFLLHVTPVNHASEWENFKKSNFENEPSFIYRLIPLDPELEKRKLYKIRIQKIDDPTLAYIFRDKRLELEKQLIMLEERKTKNFRYIGQSLYGEVSSKDLEVADAILDYVNQEEEPPELIDCQEFAWYAQREIDLYKEKFPGLDLRVQIRKDISGIMVSQSRLLISEDFSVSSKRIEALIQHEVGTHILTYCNGHRQPFHQMYAGFAGYDQLQEGLAVVAEYLVDGLTAERLRLLAARVKAVDSMIKGADFIETFRILKDRYYFKPKVAYTITMRVFRGGGFTKDAVYLTGLLRLLKYLQEGGDFDILFSGKFHLKHVPVIEELAHRKILKRPVLPPYLHKSGVRKRLKKLRNMTKLTELINQETHDYSVHR